MSLAASVKDLEEDASEILPDKKSERSNLLKNSDKGKKNNRSNNRLEAEEDIQMSPVIENINVAVEGGDDTLDLTEEVAVVEGVIKITDGTFAWHQSPVLNGINLTLPKGKLTMMLGSVGSGKSSLLWAILGEMEKLKGSQEFWLELMLTSVSASVVVGVR